MTVAVWVKITPTGVVVNGETLTTEARGVALLTEVYRAHVNDYPKFFKMDELSKLGFLATELLLQTAGDRHADSDDRAVILFGRSGSVCNDRKYQQTIEQTDDYFPSPSIFVYTLPNIVTGEIAIRKQYRSETSFFILPERDDALMRQIVEATFADTTIQSMITGWVDAESDCNFIADMEIIEKR